MNYENFMVNTEESDTIVIRKMLTRHFMPLPRYQHQRLEDLRMHLPHLKGVLTSIDQEVVGAVQLPDGTICKIDGHSRTKAWESGQLQMPEYVYVILYLGLSEEDIDILYDVKTSKSTGAKPSEEIHTANSRARFIPRSEFCKNNWLSAYKGAVGAGAAWKQIGGEDGAVAHYKPVLEIMDSWDLPNDGEKYSVGVKAAMLQTYDIDPSNWASFWVAYRDGSTTNVALNTAISNINAARNRQNSGFNTSVMRGMFLSAFETHRNS